MSLTLETFLILSLIVLIVVVIKLISSNAKVNNPPYVSIKKNALLGANDEEIEEMIVDHVYWAIGNNYKSHKKIVEQLPIPVQFVYSTWWVEAEVYNGGFNQYFINSAGDLAEIALSGYGEMNLNEYKDLLEKAKAINADILKKENKETRFYSSLEEVSGSYEDNRLNVLDEKFYKLSEASDFRIKYIRSNITKFEP